MIDIYLEEPCEKAIEDIDCLECGGICEWNRVKCNFKCLQCETMFEVLDYECEYDEDDREVYYG